MVIHSKFVDEFFWVTSFESYHPWYIGLHLWDIYGINLLKKNFIKNLKISWLKSKKVTNKRMQHKYYSLRDFVMLGFDLPILLEIKIVK